MPTTKVKKSDKAQYWINRDDLEDCQSYRILAVMLSSVRAPKLFGARNENLDSQLNAILSQETHPLIRNNFHFNRRYTEEWQTIDWLLSAYLEYGSAIGLKNWSPDFRYEVTPETHQFAKEVERLKLLPARDIKYLKDLGKRLAA